MKKEKLKVDRPKLADSVLKNKCLSLVIFSLFFMTIILILGINDFNSTEDLKATSNNFIFYSQRGSKWKNVSFCGRTGSRKSTISRSGCGTTSMAMVLANLLNDKSITPVTTMKEAQKGHYCGNSINGTSHKFFPSAAKKHNLSFYSFKKNSSGVKDIIKILNDGGLVIVNVGSRSPFTSGGHYIVLYKYVGNGNVYVADPNKLSKGTKKYNLQKDFLNKGWVTNGWWGFKAKKVVNKITTNTTTKKATKKITTQKVTKTGCEITTSTKSLTSVNYSLKCGTNTKIKSATLTLSDGKTKVSGAKVNKPTKTAKTLTSTITGLKNSKYYKLTLKTTAGKTYTKKFSVVTEDYLKKLSAGNCPTAPTKTGVLVKGSNTEYQTNKANYSVNVSTLNNTEKGNLYVLVKTYNPGRKLSYTKKGSKKEEQIGTFNDPYVLAVTGAYSTKDKKTYSKTYSGDYYYTALYSGSKKCYANYFVKDNYTLINHTRKYYLSNYNIMTQKGLVNGSSTGITASSSNKKVFEVKGLDKSLKANSLKATSQTAYSGDESSKTATVTMSNKVLSGKFKVKIVDRYWETGYLMNPLSKESVGTSEKITNSKMYSGKYNKYGKTKTKNSKGTTIYGTELKTGSKKSVYAMDAGTISAIRLSKNKSKGSKDTLGNYIVVTSTVNGKNYNHTYANLNKVASGLTKGDRVYKGQNIGTSNKNYLYTSVTYQTPDTSVGMLLSNFVGQNCSYSNITSKEAATTARKPGVCSVGSSSTTKDDTSNSDSSSKINTSNKSSVSDNIDNSSGTNNSTDLDNTSNTNNKNNSNNSNNSNNPGNSNSSNNTNNTNDSNNSGNSSNDSNTNNSVNKTCSIALSNRLPGDLDCDGKISYVDVVILLRHYGDVYKITNNDTLTIADVDNDGKVTMADLVKLNRYVGKVENRLCNKHTGKCVSR